MLCIFKNCDRKRLAKGYCAKHYYFAQRHGLLPRPECSVVDCTQPSFRHGMCNTHSLRLKRYGDPLIRKKAANGEVKNKACCIKGCSNKRAASMLNNKIYCTTHYSRIVRYGNPLTRKRLANGEATPERKKENTKRAQQNYYKTPHGILRRRFSNAKRRVFDGGTSRHIPKEEFLKLWKQDTCGICKMTVTNNDKSLDHIMPIARGGRNDIANLQIAHLRCNQVKNDNILI